MWEVLPDTDGPVSYSPKSMSNEDDTPVIFHDGFGICNREEIICDSDCVSIQTDIDDDLIDVNFNKSDSGADHLYNQLGSILSHSKKTRLAFYQSLEFLIRVSMRFQNRVNRCTYLGEKTKR